MGHRARLLPPLAFLLLVPLHYVGFPLLRKEGLIEHATHLVLFGALCLWVPLLIGRTSRAPLRWLVFVMTAYFFLEEIDYGQVYLHFDTPRWVRVLNDARIPDMNFHNNGIGDNGFALLTLFLFVVVPFNFAPPQLRSWLQRINGVGEHAIEASETPSHGGRPPARPPLISHLAGWWVLASILSFLGSVAILAGVQVQEGEPVSQELMDFLVAIGFLFVPLQQRRARAHRPASPQVDSDRV